jgi:hypothetical protein
MTAESISKRLERTLTEAEWHYTQRIVTAIKKYRVGKNRHEELIGNWREFRQSCRQTYIDRINYNLSQLRAVELIKNTAQLYNIPYIALFSWCE